MNRPVALPLTPIRSVSKGLEMAGYERGASGQTIMVFCFDSTTGKGKTGESANITVYYKEKGGSVTALTDTTESEIDSTNAPGYYEVDLGATEIDTEYTFFFAKCSTANIGAVVEKPFFTVPAGFSGGTNTVTLADGGITAAKIANDAITAAKVAADAVTEIQAGLSTFDHTTDGVLLNSTTQGQIDSIESSFSGVGIPFTTTGTPTTTSVSISGSDLGDTNGDHNRQYCFFTSGGDGVIGIGRWITTYTNTGEGTGTLAFSGGSSDPDGPLPNAPAAGVTGRILGRR